MDIDRAKDELKDFYFRQLEQGFPAGSMIKIRNMAKLVAEADEVEVTILMLDVRRDALFKMSMKKRLTAKQVVVSKLE